MHILKKMKKNTQAVKFMAQPEQKFNIKDRNWSLLWSLLQAKIWNKE